MSDVKMGKGDHVVDTGFSIGDGVRLGLKIGREGDAEPVMVAETSGDSELQHCPESHGGRVYCQRTETDHQGPARAGNAQFRIGWIPFRFRLVNLDFKA